MSAHGSDHLNQLAQALAPTALKWVMPDDDAARPLLVVRDPSEPFVVISVMVLNDALSGLWYATTDYQLLAPVTDIAKAIDALVTLLRSLTESVQDDGQAGDSR